MHTNGPVYSHLLKSTRPDGTKIYGKEDIACIQGTYADLVKPVSGEGAGAEQIGLLLGHVQSGKTKSFIGLIGLAFDNGFDVAVVLTKNSGALAEQTTRRIDKTFKHVPESQVYVRDVIKLPEASAIPVYQAHQKNILIVKKQVHNVQRAIDILTGPGSHFIGKRVLIIDDEADNASTTYYENKKEELGLAKVAKLINELRSKLLRGHFLQVTATPYSLLLQNQGEAITGKNDLKSLKPKFCQLVPVSPDYVGSHHYFKMSKDADSPCSRFYHAVDQKELDALVKPDERRFRLKDWLTTDRLSGLRTAIITFVVAGCLRRAQAKGEAHKNFALLIHTHARKATHAWQGAVVNEIINGLRQLELKSEFHAVRKLFEAAYDDLEKSIKLNGQSILAKDEAIQACRAALREGWLNANLINSDQDVVNLLDQETGELRLDTPLTIYVGGSYLDRGVTINGLIGFYYGRSPKALQQDTVLQHCRQFGFRPLADQAVTRFYTSKVLYAALERMYETDCLLRERVEQGKFHESVYILEKLTGGNVKFCSPAKIRASRVNCVGERSKVLPREFNTLNNSRNLAKATQGIIDILAKAGLRNGGAAEHAIVGEQDALEIIRLTAESIESFEEGYESTWACAEVQSLLKLMLEENKAGRAPKPVVTVLVRWNRNRPHGVKDTPDNPKIDTNIARELAVNGPVIGLFHQNGGEGWNHLPFFWPVIFPPQGNSMFVYAMSKSAKR
jgi:hypothetical protein